MYYFQVTIAAVISTIYLVKGDGSCNANCPSDQPMVCGFDESKTDYKMFSSKCDLDAYIGCHNVAYAETPIEFCLRAHNKKVLSRKMYGESCPTFCPNHWRPVCGASVLRRYRFRTFNNGCYLDMLNCRAEEDDGYEEVPMTYCQKHLMKNMFKEKIVFTGVHDYRDYE